MNVANNIKTKTPIRLQVTDRGFDFGSMVVECVTKDEFRKTATIGITTPKIDIQIRATKTGAIRIFDNNNNEYKLIKK